MLLASEDIKQKTEREQLGYRSHSGGDSVVIGI